MESTDTPPGLSINLGEPEKTPGSRNEALVISSIEPNFSPSEFSNGERSDLSRSRGSPKKQPTPKTTPVKRRVSLSMGDRSEETTPSRSRFNASRSTRREDVGIVSGMLRAAIDGIKEGFSSVTNRNSSQRKLSPIDVERSSAEDEMHFLQRKFEYTTLVDRYDPEFNNQTVCYNCNGFCSTMVRTCKRCVKAQYCSKECEFAHWERHRQVCTSYRIKNAVEIKPEPITVLKTNVEEVKREKLVEEQRIYDENNAEVNREKQQVRGAALVHTSIMFPHDRPTPPQESSRNIFGIDMNFHPDKEGLRDALEFSNQTCCIVNWEDPQTDVGDTCRKHPHGYTNADQRRSLEAAKHVQRLFLRCKGRTTHAELGVIETSAIASVDHFFERILANNAIEETYVDHHHHRRDNDNYDSDDDSEFEEEFYDMNFDLFGYNSGVRSCDNCFKRIRRDRRCTKCDVTDYCSSKCQSDDYFEHRDDCARFKQAAAEGENFEYCARTREIRNRKRRIKLDASLMIQRQLIRRNAMKLASLDPSDSLWESQDRAAARLFYRIPALQTMLESRPALIEESCRETYCDFGASKDLHANHYPIDPKISRVEYQSLVINGVHFVRNTHQTSICDYCSEVCYDVDPCDGCLKAYYCGVQCKSNDWRKHKQCCNFLQNDDKPSAWADDMGESWRSHKKYIRDHSACDQQSEPGCIFGRSYDAQADEFDDQADSLLRVHTRAGRHFERQVKTKTGWISGHSKLTIVHRAVNSIHAKTTLARVQTEKKRHMTVSLPQLVLTDRISRERISSDFITDIVDGMLGPIARIEVPGQRYCISRRETICANPIIVHRIQAYGFQRPTSYRAALGLIMPLWNMAEASFQRRSTMCGSSYVPFYSKNYDRIVSITERLFHIADEKHFGESNLIPTIRNVQQADVNFIRYGEFERATHSELCINCDRGILKPGELVRFTAGFSKDDLAVFIKCKHPFAIIKDLCSEAMYPVRLSNLSKVVSTHIKVSDNLFEDICNAAGSLDSGNHLVRWRVPENDPIESISSNEPQFVADCIRQVSEQITSHFRNESFDVSNMSSFGTVSPSLQSPEASDDFRGIVQRDSTILPWPRRLPLISDERNSNHGDDNTTPSVTEGSFEYPSDLVDYAAILRRVGIPNSPPPSTLSLPPAILSHVLPPEILTLIIGDETSSPLYGAARQRLEGLREYVNDRRLAFALRNRTFNGIELSEEERERALVRSRIFAGLSEIQHHEQGRINEAYEHSNDEETHEEYETDDEYLTEEEHENEYHATVYRRGSDYRGSEEETDDEMPPLVIRRLGDAETDDEMPPLVTERVGDEVLFRARNGDLYRPVYMTYTENNDESDVIFPRSSLAPFTFYNDYGSVASQDPEEMSSSSNPEEMSSFNDD